MALASVHACIAKGTVGKSSAGELVGRMLIRPKPVGT